MMAEKNKMIDGKENAKEETSDLNTKGRSQKNGCGNFRKSVLLSISLL